VVHACEKMLLLIIASKTIKNKRLNLIVKLYTKDN